MERFKCDAESVADYRIELRAVARGIPTAEAAVEGFTDLQVVEAMERMWAAGTEPVPAESSPSRS